MSEATQGNPFAGPNSQLVDPNCKGVWRDEGSLIARDRFARFPAKCIVCGNQNDCRPVKCTVRIRPGLAFFFIPVLAAFSPSVSISPYMCTTHRRRDQLYRWIGHAIALTAACALFGPFIIMGIVDGAPVELMFLTTLAVLLWPVWIFYRVFRPRTVWAQKIDGKNAKLTNVHPSVLNAVPPFPKNDVSPA